MVFLKSLIGSYAGSVRDYPAHAASNLLQNGTHIRPTEEEIMDAGHRPLTSIDNTVESFPPGYKAVRLDDYDGLDVYGPSNEGPLNDQPFRNLVAARAFAEQYAEKQLTDLPLQQEITRKDRIVIPDDWRNLGPTAIHQIAMQLDASTPPGDDALLVVASEEDRRREIAGLPPLDAQTGEPLKAPEPEPEPAPKRKGKSAAV